MTEFESSRHYRERVEAAIGRSLRSAPAPGEDPWAVRAASFRLDPRRKLEANTRALIDLIEPGDSVLDIGGGAGRLGLPVALHCREMINLEPSAAMRAEFDASARDAGITNARCLDASWPGDADGLEADVIMVANVTYFVRDIQPFLEAMDRCARRRAIISVWSVPPPSHGASLIEFFHGQAPTIAPSHRELLPVLWDMGLLPEVHVLPDGFWRARERPATRTEAVELALLRGNATELEGAAARVEAHFDELFETTPRGFLPKWIPATRELLITWTKA